MPLTTGLREMRCVSCAGREVILYGVCNLLLFPIWMSGVGPQSVSHVYNVAELLLGGFL